MIGDSLMNELGVMWRIEPTDGQSVAIVHDDDSCKTVIELDDNDIAVHIVGLHNAWLRKMQESGGTRQEFPLIIDTFVIVGYFLWMLAMFGQSGNQR